MDKNKQSPRVSTRGVLKKQVDDFMTDFGSELAKLNEKLNVFSKSIFELLKIGAITRKHTTSIAHEFTEMRQKLISMDERITGMNDRKTKLEQGLNIPTYQAPSLALTYADIVGTTSPTTNVIQTPPPAERLK